TGLTADNAALKAMLSLAQASVAADPGASHNLTWNFDSGSQAFDYLAAGQQLVLTYTVKAADATLNDTHAVTITITGTNDAPVISVLSGDSDAKGLTETNAGLTSSGTLSVSDADVSDTDATTVD